VARILEGGLVDMNLNPTLSTIAGTSAAQPGTATQVPIISTRSTTANITIKSGQAAVIGGILQDSATFNQSSVPTFQSLIRPLSRTALKCLLSRSTKAKKLITYQNLVRRDYARKRGKSRTFANKFGMCWYVTRA
jgi:type II/III secretion system protein